MACFNRRSSLPSLSPAHRRIKCENRPHKLDLIENSPIHRLTLIDWTAQLSAGNNNLGRKLSSRNASISDLYQILGLFFVFEGVIITAVAQANGIKCRNSWIIFTLSLIASVATLCACIQKLKEFADADRSYSEERDLCSALNASIQQLKEQGPAFDIVEGQPTLLANRSFDSPGFGGFCKKWVWSYAGAVCAVVLAFSGATLVAVSLILCHRQ